MPRKILLHTAIHIHTLKNTSTKKEIKTGIPGFSSLQITHCVTLGRSCKMRRLDQTISPRSCSTLCVCVLWNLYTYSSISSHQLKFSVVNCIYPVIWKWYQEEVAKILKDQLLWGRRAFEAVVLEKKKIIDKIDCNPGTTEADCPGYMPVHPLILEANGQSCF